MLEKWKSLSHGQLFVTPWISPVHGILQARILVWVAFPFSRLSSQPRDWTQVSRIAGGFFNQLSHKGSPRILEWVAYHFSSRSSQHRSRTGVSCIAGGFFTNWPVKLNLPNIFLVEYSTWLQPYSETVRSHTPVLYPFTASAFLAANCSHLYRQRLIQRQSQSSEELWLWSRKAQTPYREMG